MERHAVPARPPSTTPTRRCRDTSWNYWNLIKFNEHPARRRHVPVADAQGSVHALRRSRLPARLSRRRRDRAVHQRHRRLPAGELHRLPVLRVRLSVRHSEVQSGDEEGLQVHAVLRPRRQGLEPACIKACPTGCLHFGTKDDMLQLAEKRASNCASIPASKMPACTTRRHRRNHVVYVLHDATNPEKYGGLPKNPRSRWSFTRLERLVQAPGTDRCPCGICWRYPALRHRGAAARSTAASRQGRSTAATARKEN